MAEHDATRHPHDATTHDLTTHDLTTHDLTTEETQTMTTGTAARGEPTTLPAPTDVAEPTDATRPTDTTGPTDTAEPTDTTGPTDTAEPTDLAEPTDTAEPTGNAAGEYEHEHAFAAAAQAGPVPSGELPYGAGLDGPGYASVGLDTAPEARRRGPDPLTLLVGLATLAMAVFAFVGQLPDLSFVDPRWLLAGGAAAVGLFLLVGNLRGRSGHRGGS